MLTALRSRSVQSSVIVVGSAFAFLLCGCSSGAKPFGKSGGTPQPVDFVAHNAGRLLHGRRLVLSLRAPNRNEDVWLLDHGRVVNVSKKVRIAAGGDGCYGADYGGGQGPCYEVAEPFSLSRAGDRLAFFLMDTSGAPDATPPALIVSRADGSHARQVAARLGICVLCQVSTPSWDRNGRSFVVAVEWFAGTYSDNSITKIYRVSVRSGRARLLSPPGAHAYSEDEPAISPDGKQIAFLRNASQGPWAGLSAPPAFVYLMRANGTGRRRLPLPRRAYSSASYWGHNSLWWASSSILCAGSPATTYCVDLRTGHVTQLRHWPESSYNGLSADGAIAVKERKARHGWEVLVGPVNAKGIARLAPLLAATHLTRNPFFEFSISGP